MQLRYNKESRTLTLTGNKDELEAVSDTIKRATWGNVDKGSHTKLRDERDGRSFIVNVERREAHG